MEPTYGDSLCCECGAISAPYHLVVVDSVENITNATVRYYTGYSLCEKCAAEKAIVLNEDEEDAE